jgi:hypothetical protein
MVRNEDIAVLDLQLGAGVGLADALDEMPVDRGVEEHRRRHDQPPFAVKNHAAKIARLADDG